MNTPLVAAGTRLVNAFNRETFIFTKPVESEEEAEFDVLLESDSVHGDDGVSHIHPKSEEYFTVRAGSLKVVIDGKARLVGPGETVVVPRGRPHYFRNGHDGETLFTIRFEPGMKFLRFFLEFGTALETHPEWYDEKGNSSLLLSALAFNEFPDQIYVAGPPIWLQKLIFAMLAPIARLKGYHLPFRRGELARKGEPRLAHA